MQRRGPLPAGGPYLVQGVSWLDGVPHLDVVDVRADRGLLHPLVGNRLGLRVDRDARYCLGWYGPTGATGIGHLACPRQVLVEAGDQCPECAARDEFRFVHHAHTGGYLPDGLAAYLVQPHWLYVATFADGTSKIGTASQASKRSRLDQQGAVAATYVARAGDGWAVRHAEDDVTRAIALPQTKRRTAKVAALTRPAPRAQVRQQHEDTVAQVREVLAPLVHRDDLEVSAEPWTPPAAYEPFLDDRPRSHWVPYPHDLAPGEHGWLIDGCAGPAALARTGSGVAAPADEPQYVVDLGALTGLRVFAGEFSSPDAVVQTALF